MLEFKSSCVAIYVGSQFNPISALLTYPHPFISVYLCWRQMTLHQGALFWTGFGEMTWVPNVMPWFWTGDMRAGAQFSHMRIVEHWNQQIPSHMLGGVFSVVLLLRWGSYPHRANDIIKKNLWRYLKAFFSWTHDVGILDLGGYAQQLQNNRILANNIVYCGNWLCRLRKAFWIESWAAAPRCIQHLCALR